MQIFPFRLLRLNIPAHDIIGRELNLNDEMKRILSSKDSKALDELVADLVFTKHPDKSFEEIIELYSEYETYSKSQDEAFYKASGISLFSMFVSNFINERESGVRSAENHFEERKKSSYKVLNNLKEKGIVPIHFNHHLD